MLVTSVQNPRIKAAAALKDRRGREESGRTLVEGYRLITRALESGFPLEECFYCPSMFIGVNEQALLRRLEEAGVSLVEVAPRVLEKISYRERPEGLAAVGRFAMRGLESLPVVKNGLYLVVEGVEKPGNLGSILRSADAVGAVGILLCDKRTDLYNPNTLTASTGAVFFLPVAECGQDEALAWLRGAGVRILAATPHTDKAHYDVDLTTGVAIAVGAEQYGLSAFWLDKADLNVRIPMAGKTDSLNVAIAASVLLFEAARQRAAR